MSRPDQHWVDVWLTDADRGVAAGNESELKRVAAEVRALRNELAYERTLRNGLELMLKELDTQLTAADEVLP